MLQESERLHRPLTSDAGCTLFNRLVRRQDLAPNATAFPNSIMTTDHCSPLQCVCSITHMTRLMLSQGVAGRARGSSPTLCARRFWLPIVDPLFHGSFGRRLARNSFEPYGLVATAIRVSPPHGEVIPSIETNPDLVLEVLIFLHYRRSTTP